MTLVSVSSDHAAQLREEGCTVVPAVLGADEVATAKAALATAIEEDRAAGQILFRAGVDPNDRNIRVLQLLGRHPIWERFVDHPVARGLAATLLGDDAYLLSSLSANVALPGSESMGLHCDLMSVLPEPWLAPHGVNVFFYLDDTDEANGATRYLPGSHRFTDHTMASAGDLAATRPFEAPAGSMVAIDGRLWHTSGANTSADRSRDVVISFYIADFIRPQYNWHALLSEATKAALAPGVRDLLGLDLGNMKLRMRYEAFAGSRQAAQALHVESGVTPGA
jgi:ectoine hydroxylase-related dioxygenase (phytanoyl-CoA dioxygenase family)